jgi:hypothetical protein
MVDLDELLRLKSQEVNDAFIRAAVEHWLGCIASESAKGTQADPEKLREYRRNIFAIANPNRAEQVARHLDDPAGRDRLLAICDFIAIPYSFDILVFLAIAEKRRQALGLSKLDVAFVGHDSDPGIDGHTAHPDLRMKYRTLANNIGIQAARLFPSIGSILMFDNRPLFYDYLGSVAERVQIFPDYYDVKQPIYQPEYGSVSQFAFVYMTGEGDPAGLFALTPPADDVEFARRWLRANVEGKIPVTLTLRNAGFDRAKNSSIDIWSAALARFADGPFKFILIPDYSDAFAPSALSGDHIVSCDMAALSLTFRAALYQSVSFNLFVNNGPMSLGYLSQDVNFLAFDLVHETNSARLDDLERVSGLRYGENFWGATPFQRVIWEPTSVDVVEREVGRLAEDLARADCLYPAWLVPRSVSVGG